MKLPLRSAFVYAAEGKPIIVSALHFNSAGIYYEQDEPKIIMDGGWKSVVPSLRNSLASFSLREADLRDRNPTDWPSYRASKLRSVQQFQSHYLRFAIVAVNEAELFYAASARPRGEEDITLQVTLNPYGSDEEIARLLERLFHACLHWSETATS